MYMFNNYSSKLNNIGHNIENDINNDFIVSIIEGNLEKVKFIRELTKNYILSNRFNKYEALIIAVKHGKLDIVKFFCKGYFVEDVNLNLYMLTIINIAEEQKHFKVIEYLIEFYSQNIKNIIMHNKNNYYALLYAKKIFSKYMLKAVQYACFNVIKYLYELGLMYSINPNFNNIALKKATIRGNLEVFKFFFKLALSKNKNYLPKYTMIKVSKIAAIHGNNDIIKFLLKFPNCKEIKKIDIQIILIILKEISSRPFMENKISHKECYELIKYLLDNNLQRISIENLLEIREKINHKINHLNYDKNKCKLFFEYINKAINLQMMVVCSALVKKCLPIEGVGYNIATYLYKEKSSIIQNSKILCYMRDKINDKCINFNIANSIEHTNVKNFEEKINKNKYKKTI